MLEYTGTDLTPSTDRSVTLVAGGGSVQVDNPGTMLTLAGPITGLFGLTKTGSGGLTLSNQANSFGNLTINAGTLAISGAMSSASPVVVNPGALLSLVGNNATGNSLGGTAGPWTINGGTVSADGAGGSGTTEIINGNLVLNTGNLATSLGGYNSNYGNFFLYDNGAQVQVGGTAQSVISACLKMAGTHTFNVVPTGDPSGIDLMVSGELGNLEGTAWGFITKTGAGTMAISNSSNLIGSITVSAGKVLFQDSMSGMLNGGLIDNAAVETNISSGLTASFGYLISGSGSVTKSGPGTLVLNTVTESYTGPTVVTGGTLVLNSGPTIQSSSSLTITNGTVQTGALDPFGVGTVTPITINASGMLTQNVAQNVNLGAVTLSGGELASNGLFDPMYGSYYLEQDIHVTGSATSTISALAITSGGPETFNVDAGSTLNVTGYFSNLYGSFGLIKAGGGTMILSNGLNAYASGTDVEAGTLIATTSGAIPDGTSLTVGAGGALIFEASAAAGGQSLAASCGAVVAAVPEPGTLALLAVGAMLTLLYRRRRR